LAGLFNIILIIVATFFLLVAVFFVLRGLRARESQSGSAYGVARQESRHVMLVSFTRGAVLFLVALIIFAIYGLLPREENLQAEDTSIPEGTASPTITISDTRVPPTSPRQIGATQTATLQATDLPVLEDTKVPDPTPAPTSANQSTTAVVSSINGLWLRSEPDPEGDQLELILDETLLIILRETEPSNQTEWQFVRSPSGNEGWVFKQFIIFQQDE
jgi:hypothetical protein